MELRHFDVLLYPPAINIILFIASIILIRVRWLAFSLFTVSIITLTLASMPIVSHALVKSLYQHPPIPPEELSNYHDAGAIIVLGGGFWPNAVEFGGHSLRGSALMRTRYAAFIAKRTGLPVIVSSGDTLNTGISEAPAMLKTLKEEFDIDNVWMESGSKNTFENAKLSIEILRKKGIKRVFLVTSHYHMTRSVKVFEQLGYHVIAAPVGVRQDEETTLRHYIPRAGSMKMTRAALHEYLGMLWYQLRYF